MSEEDHRTIQSVLWDDLEELEDKPLGGQYQQSAEVGGDIRCTAATPKAILCEFPDGVKRWVPKSAVLPASEVHDKGDVGTLVVAEWLSDQWDKEDPEPPKDFSFPNTAVLQHSDKAVYVRIPNKGAHWFPRTQLAKGNQCEYDGDLGELRVSEWVAKQKGLVDE